MHNSLNQKFSKLVCMLSAASMTLLIPMTALAASHSVSYYFKYALQGPTRSFSSGSITLDIYSTSGKKDTMSIGLHKKNLVGGKTIGTTTAPTSGSHTKTWTGISAGDYYLSFTKTNNGIYVSGSGTIRN